jgi:hypothetical protein
MIQNVAGPYGALLARDIVHREEKFGVVSRMVSWQRADGNQLQEFKEIDLV